MTLLPEHDQNAHLLIDLFLNTRATHLGKVDNFFSVLFDWRCPCCFRSKRDFARLDKNGGLLCSIHSHHDHFVRHLKKCEGEPAAWAALWNSCVRFPDTLICGDCNVAEAAAKNKVDAPENFSFAPYEIANFIEVHPNQANEVNAALAQETYAAAVPAMSLIAKRVRAITSAARGSEGGWEPIGDVAARLVQERGLKLVK